MKIDEFEFRDTKGNEIEPTKIQLVTYIKSLHKQIKQLEFEHNNYFVKAEATINFLQKQFNEKGILEEQIDSLKQQLAEKEIEYQENMKILAVDNQNKKAIEQLEKVKEVVKHFCELHSDEFYGVKSQVMGIREDVFEFIDRQLNELKGKVEDVKN